MKRSERACQIWAVLALCAKNRQTITYGILSKLTGIAAQGLGQCLEPIQSYCLLNELPPLTILVVQQDSGFPGDGFTGSRAEIFAKDLIRVFDQDWLAHGNPQPDKLEEAAAKRPSNGV
ncbi:hypothetical protein L9G74_11165 [Shewanella sp. C32]|uniref:Uncharacterized protein n=1 Tax=Shewanella electrica TaxID=515560 RepID=A0ABT2FKY7_9GAMM|nr:hypothetical protein [Shewanella electrica]MCH1923786.1 hypothetical protein [Shewanella electrica]MCS4557004.1 hypothetical protein [Shewanella electrica]